MVYTKAQAAPAIKIFDIGLPTDQLGLKTDITAHRTANAHYFMRIVTQTGNAASFLVSLPWMHIIGQSAWMFCFGYSEVPEKRGGREGLIRKFSNKQRSKCEEN